MHKYEHDAHTVWLCASRLVYLFEAHRFCSSVVAIHFSFSLYFGWWCYAHAMRRHIDAYTIYLSPFVYLKYTLYFVQWQLCAQEKINYLLYFVVSDCHLFTVWAVISANWMFNAWYNNSDRVKQKKRIVKICLGYLTELCEQQKKNTNHHTSSVRTTMLWATNRFWFIVLSFFSARICYYFYCCRLFIFFYTLSSYSAE